MKSFDPEKSVMSDLRVATDKFFMGRDENYLPEIKDVSVSNNDFIEINTFWIKKDNWRVKKRTWTKKHNNLSSLKKFWITLYSLPVINKVFIILVMSVKRKQICTKSVTNSK